MSLTAEEEETLLRYCTINGKIPAPYAKQLINYDISDPNSEKFLVYCVWEDYRTKNSYHNCIAKNSDFYLSVTKKYSLNDLKSSIRHFTKEDPNQYGWHIDKMNKNYNKIKSNLLSIEDKKACALALSYYTGFKDNSDRDNRNVNVLIRGENLLTKVNNWNDGNQFYPVLYYTSLAIANLPFYWGYTIRCVQMNNKVANYYQPGTVITWLKYSSSKIGKEPAHSFRERNTWFLIYSFNSREISQFSVYSEEKEALYSPFSSFLVFKKISQNGKNLIYMRQIEIGLYVNNIVWVDDNILNSDWENKGLMEMAYSIKRDLKIIPKITTECALAFLISFRPFLRDKKIKYKIMSDMNRNNEPQSHNAGARLVKYMQENNLYDIEIMIFTSSSDKAIEEMKKLGVQFNKYIKVTTSSSEALKYLISS